MPCQGREPEEEGGEEEEEEGGEVWERVQHALYCSHGDLSRGLLPAPPHLQTAREDTWLKLLLCVTFKLPRWKTLALRGEWRGVGEFVFPSCVFAVLPLLFGLRGGSCLCC